MPPTVILGVSLAPMATFNYLLADNCSAAELPLPSPFKTTILHQKSCYYVPPELRCAEQSQKGKQEDICQAMMLQIAAPLAAPLPEGLSLLSHVLSASRKGTVEVDFDFLLLRS